MQASVVDYELYDKYDFIMEMIFSELKVVKYS